MSKYKQTADDRRWIEAIVDWANNYGTYPLCVPFQIHHVKGRSYKHKQIDIGHKFVLPVTIALHDVGSNDPLNVTHNPKGFEK